ncbi:hypothetical protein H4R19_002935 [Coemansia spiralis]|nr:hypothetical protein H4R19_002935 [Coemansia spiralis]
MRAPPLLLVELEPFVTCPFCRRVLHRPRTIRGCQHSVCRLCLDQILARSTAPQCPACQLVIPEAESACLPGASTLERLLDCYYILKRAAHRGRTSLQSTDSGLSEATIDTVVDRYVSPVSSPPLSPGRLQPLVPETPAGSSQMTSAGAGARQRSSAIDAELRLGLVSDLVGGDSSGSDTDLDLPNPVSFLAPSQRRLSPEAAETASNNAVKYVPETPPQFAGGPSTPLVRTPGSPRGKATYSARATPGSRRSLGSALAARERPAIGPLPTSGGSSSLTAVDGNPPANEHMERTPRAQRTPSKRLLPAASPTPPTAKRKMSARKPAAAKAGPPAPETPERADGSSGGLELRLLCTGLSEAQMARVQRAAKQAQQLVSSVAVHRNADMLGEGGGYTHLVVATGKDGRAARTFKYLAGLATGAWVVTAGWLLDSVKAGRLLPEADYAATGDSAMPQFSLSGPRQPGELLQRHAVHLWGDAATWDAGSAHSYGDLRNLLTAVGAAIMDTLPTHDGSDEDAQPSPSQEPSAAAGPRHAAARPEKDELAALPPKYRRLFELPVREGETVVLVSGSDLAGARSSVALGAIVGATGGTVPCRTKTWLFDCISANRIV